MKIEQIAKHLKNIGLELSRVEEDEPYLWKTNPKDMAMPQDYFYSAIHAFKYWEIKTLEQYQSVLALHDFMLCPPLEQRMEAIKSWIDGETEIPQLLIAHQLRLSTTTALPGRKDICRMVSVLGPIHKSWIVASARRILECADDDRGVESLISLIRKEHGGCSYFPAQHSSRKRTTNISL